MTTKSDVYAFGVVLMEPLTGQQALSRDSNPGNDQYSEHRSLVDCVSAHHFYVNQCAVSEAGKYFNCSCGQQFTAGFCSYDANRSIFYN